MRSPRYRNWVAMMATCVVVLSGTTAVSHGAPLKSPDRNRPAISDEALKVKKTKVKVKPFVPKVVKVALRYQGTPYVWGGTSPSGFDCSGFTQYVLHKVGVSIPRVTTSQIGVGTSIPNISHARAGDLLFPSYGHVMMYIGRGKAIHSPQSGDVVHVVLASSRTYIAIRRPPGLKVTKRRSNGSKVRTIVYRQHVLP